MPAQDVYHNVVKQALIKDGWTITVAGFIVWSFICVSVMARFGWRMTGRSMA